MKNIQNHLDKLASKGVKQLAVLIDPDKINDVNVLAEKIKEADVDLVFVGGSLLITDAFATTIATLKKKLECPVVIFPGHPMQISSEADGILLLSLISGRNSDLLIGQHVHAAPKLKASGLEILPTGYLLIDSGSATTASYISHTHPIPRNKPEIASCTAMAGEMLGLKNVYLEAGSGAQQSVPLDMIKAVKEKIDIPLLVGGGIRDKKTMIAVAKAGADIIVVGTAIEENNSLIKTLSKAIHSI